MESILEEVITAASPLAAVLDEGVLGVPASALLLGGLFVGILAYALFVGKKMMLASLFSVIFAGFVFSVFPYREMIAVSVGEGNPQNELYANIGVFAVLALLVFFAIRHSVRAGYFEDGSRKLPHALCLSVITSGLLLVYAYQFTSLRELNPISSSFIAPLITAPQALFWWLAGGFLVVYLFSD